MIIKKIKEWLYVREVVREFDKTIQHCDTSKRIHLFIMSTMNIDTNLSRKISKALNNKYKKLGKVSVRLILPECSFDVKIDLLID